MDKGEARIKGILWTDFKDIPQALRTMYDMVLALNPIADAVVMGTGTYEMCCEYWVNNKMIRLCDESLSSE